MRYEQVNRLDKIPDIIGASNAYILSGGSSIMCRQKNGGFQPDDVIIDISYLDELRGISSDAGIIEIGALTSLAEIASNELIIEYIPALAKAASTIASPLIRNIATIAGNLAESSPFGDIMPVLYVFDTKLELQQGFSIKEISIDGFCTGPYSNILFNGEIIKKIKIPINKESISGFTKLSGRKALSRSKVSLAVNYSLDGSQILDIKISMAALGSKCTRAWRTEEILRGEKLTEMIVSHAADIIKYDASPIDDCVSTKNYRRKMLGVLLKRLLKKKP